MHEMSLCQGVLDSIVPVARQAGAARITEVRLTIGEMTMVVREAMEFAFEALTEGDPFLEGAELTMEFVAPRSMCLDCGSEFEHDRFHLACTACGSRATSLVAGRELEIASIEIDDGDADAGEPGVIDEGASGEETASDKDGNRA